MLELLYVFGSGLALFLLGANLAFLIDLGKVLTGWFVVKIAAVSGIMLYMSMSLYVGTPGPWRASLGVLAMLVDVGALGYMWYSIESLRSKGVTGMIPIGKLGD